ncbi:MAG TPA: sigma-54 dependent transcriptional regulator [Pirellulales bacterium]|jgi:DNA-binding NtrC family response regulator|nr:sigma-54 dependent transcriptional regulator [Pirellulales bacterium]
MGDYSPEKIDLLIVDDDAEFRSTVLRRFGRRGFRVQEASDGSEALQWAARREFNVAIVDLVMPGISGLELLAKLKEAHPDCEILLLTGQGTIETAVEAMKRGAYDFLTKPFPLAELEVLIQKAYERQQLQKENKQLSAALERTAPTFEIVGNSAPMREVFRLIDRAGPTDKAILIQGASGTGKELVARALHRASKRSEKPFVAINCAALPESLLESELFGHEKGAFTGAIATKLGLFEVADGGTLFIDEIGEMPGALQAKLLRVLEDGSMRRVGSLKEIRVDVRLLAATNRNLQQEVQAGRFREDLFYRINVLSLALPRLSERAGDVRLLVARFLGDAWKISDEAMAALERYDWPGNVRQLVNVIERAKILGERNLIEVVDLPGEILRAQSNPATLLADGEDRLAAIQRAHVVSVLDRTKGNKARAARMLGVTRRSLYRLIEKFGLHVPAGENSLAEEPADA